MGLARLACGSVALTQNLSHLEFHHEVIRILRSESSPDGREMSGKIKAKDLSYDTSLPPFLQRLHAAKGGSGDSDRHERAIARPKQAKDVNEDDGPTMVDEDGETLTKDEYEKLTKAGAATENSNAAPDGAEATSNVETTATRPDQKVTDGVAVKKRKLAKVVGDEDGAPNEVQATASKTPKKAKKKPKPVKLAFDDDDGT
ncbi:unnamed protein product [Zymoseptoria tritici ST99CH_1A5]|uniref:DUF4604 domain-containing protein n=1 Tax=Zymoseptoria tritici ST99CH_1A5 TaxID=1276529 RepID=A0A1Y6LGR7_ZYMTR|nr:unnamed protein product [Zymoseptoria tritici ST99CH_1A5]